MRPYRIIDFHTYKPPKKGRRLAVILIDYFSIVVMTFFFFGTLCRPVYDNLALTQGIWEKYNQAGEDLMTIVQETHLQEEEDDRLVPLEESATTYLSFLLQTSYLENGIIYSEVDDSGQLVEKTILPEETLLAEGFVNDPLAYYFLGFRQENGLSKEGEDGYHYLNCEVLDLDDTNKDLVAPDFDLGGVFYLDEENSQWLYNALILKDEASAGTSLVSRLKTLYASSCSKGIQEVETSYAPYIEAYGTFQAEYSKYIIGYDVSLILAYVLGFLFVDLLFPVIFRNGRTLSYRAFSLACADGEARPIPFYKYLIKGVFQFVLQFSAIFFSPLFLGALDMMMIPFLGPLTMLQFIIFSLMIGILSTIYAMISKNGQTLSELASITYTVDLNRHEEEGAFEVDSGGNR